MADIKAVIFDMDGVLVNSMRYHVLAWQKAFKPMGLNISSDEVYMREGESWQKSTRDFLLMAGFKPDKKLIEKVFKKRSRIFKDIFKPIIFKGAKGLLTLIKEKGFLLGLVTATPKDEVENMLPNSMLSMFDAMVCGGDTKNGKPHPEPYLRALEKLMIKPSEAVVIENAPYGITSSKLAGIRCIAVTTSLPKEHLKSADIIFKSLSSIGEYFTRIKE